jgi:tetrapyrrole methylase family protein/MazG family protein/ATP diphosphatase
MPFDPPSPDLPPLERLLEIMARLRDPDGGCPWDREQTFATIAPYTVEEAYEVADAIARGDMAHLKEELGDLLLQVVFHARMAQEQGAFDFNDVAAAISDKMIRRHPHVFAEQSYRDVAEQTAAWEAIKAQERAGKAAGGVLDDVPPGMPGLTRAVKLTKRAARVGFDWPSVHDVLAKLREELGELEAEIEASDDEAARQELGDLLFVCANLARKLDIDPEDAVRFANAKFVRRFAYIEQGLAARGLTPEQSSLAEMDALWNEVRAQDKLAPSDPDAGQARAATRAPG